MRKILDTTVQQAAAAPPEDKIDAVDVAVDQAAAPGLGHDVVPVQQEAGVLLPYRLAGAELLGVVAVEGSRPVYAGSGLPAKGVTSSMGRSNG